MITNGCLWTWLLLNIVTVKSSASTDPCLQVKNDYLPNLIGRGLDCNDTDFASKGCDNFLVRAWYRSNSPIVTSKPPLASCGTSYPIWMNGTHPDVADGIVSRVACVNNIYGSCDKSYNIQVKNCYAYYAYYLSPATACKERYCFEKSKYNPCPTTTTPMTTPMTTTTFLKKPDKHCSENEVCLSLPAFIAVIMVIMVVFVVALILVAFYIKRRDLSIDPNNAKTASEGDIQNGDTMKQKL